MTEPEPLPEPQESDVPITDTGRGYPEFEKPPFVRKHLDTTTDIITVRLNSQERAELEGIKALLRLEADGTALKICLSMAQKVLLTLFDKEMITYLCSPRRLRQGRKCA